ncbi:MAG TPA: MerR family transcriptional regulator [Terriglobia bacterium]|nr:MerR family transcriptional regulator [Terriglobia bacterium]
MKGTNLYQARQFAVRAGVTVRALHHYDRLGLLKPSGRTSAGYRLYAESDLARLQQIVTLKFIGFSLKQIRDLLHRKAFDLPVMLRLQRKIIEEKRSRLDLAIQAIERAEHVAASHAQKAAVAGTRRRTMRVPDAGTDWEVFRQIIEVINMQQDTEWTKKYYSDTALSDLAERGKQWTPEMLRQVEQDWAALIQEVEAANAAGENPASDHAQALAARWQKLLAGFTGGNPEVQAGLKRLYADQQNWPSSFKKPYSDEACAFIGKAMEAAKKSQ